MERNVVAQGESEILAILRVFPFSGKHRGVGTVVLVDEQRIENLPGQEAGIDVGGKTAAQSFRFRPKGYDDLRRCLRVIFFSAAAS
jgi:hypothetical protein